MHIANCYIVKPKVKDYIKFFPVFSEVVITDIKSNISLAFISIEIYFKFREFFICHKFLNTL
nr:MAG TPA: hypothetical protein [Caudoviricetes sp.]